VLVGDALHRGHPDRARTAGRVAPGRIGRPIVRERKGREEHDDLRPSVLALAVSDEPGPAPADRTVGLVAELATQPRGVRPAELARGLVAVSGPPPGVLGRNRHDR